MWWGSARPARARWSAQLKRERHPGVAVHRRRSWRRSRPRRRSATPVIEIHTGAWCDAVVANDTAVANVEFKRITEGATRARGLGLEVHAGHGLDFATAERIAALPEIVELNIGHFLIGAAVFRWPRRRDCQDHRHGRGRTRSRSSTMILASAKNIRCRRITKVIERHGERFSIGILTATTAQQSGAPAQPRRPMPIRAEACAKALGTAFAAAYGARHRHHQSVPSAATMQLSGNCRTQGDHARRYEARIDHHHRQGPNGAGLRG